MTDEWTTLVDCDAGRAKGCGNLCCRLIVALSAEDIINGLEPQSPISGILKQERDGYCTYLDREDLRCTVWDKRPFACSLYNCNNDPMLQAVLRHGFSSFTKAMEQMEQIPKEDWIAIPLLKSDDEKS